MRWMVAAVLLLVTLTGCRLGGSSDDTEQYPVPLRTINTTDGSGSQKAEKAARKVAQEESDRYASGDFGGAWDLWSAKSKKVISRKDYAAFGRTCANSAVPITITVSSISVDTGKTATANLSAGGFQQEYKMTLEHGHWTWVPNAALLKVFAGGLQKSIAAAVAAGTCVSATS